MSLIPPFTQETATQKVKRAQDLWNTKDPGKVVKAYTPNSVWRNRTTFVTGHAAIERFLTAKWERELEYRLRKELFAFMGNRIAVQFWYEFRDRDDGLKWKRCYGLEHWTFDADGTMRDRRMSGNDALIEEGGRWFENVDDVNSVDLEALHAKEWAKTA
ncbi:MAG: hypothetical protein M4579_001325 [Chaenotheca gracillima]|nr:MAG: hypothetical protein M4579_001325 [Chaenotheca gracillima]